MVVSDGLSGFLYLSLLGNVEKPLGNRCGNKRAGRETFSWYSLRKHSIVSLRLKTEKHMSFISLSSFLC